MAMEQPYIQLALAKLIEALKVCQDMESLVFMERGLLSPVMVMEAMVPPLSQSHSLIMVMDITHNLTAMDTTLEVMERERLNQVMELVMVSLSHLSIHMEDQVLTIEPLKDFPVMDIMVTERDLLSQDMELELVTQLFIKAA